MAGLQADRLMEKHSAYYNLLESLDKPDCPVCAQVEKSIKAFLDSYLYEGVTDEDNWDRLVASDGYCPRHTAWLENFSDGLAVALFYRYLTGKRLEELGREKKPGFFKKPEPCPACGAESDIEDTQSSLIAQALDEPEFKAAMEKHPGLCLAHTRQLASKAGAAKTRELAKKQFAPLLAELDEFIRKSDYRNEEKMGPEGDSWRRILKKFHGTRYPRGLD